MSQIGKDFYKEYAAELDRLDFPDELREEFTLEACIGSSESGETYLCRQKGTDVKCVVKVRGAEQKYRVDIEENLLHRLQEMEFPAARALKRIDTGEKIFLVREYVEGETLEEYFQRRSGLTEWEIAEIGMAVCEQLQRLHESVPALVHRDIKPQNIVITPGGEARLIDFDAARLYEEGKERDTYFFGTMQTAAPEQYGFEQTDARTDLYGLGKTLLWLACGSYTITALEKTRYSARFKRSIRKSVSLLKKERFQSAADMYKSLNKCRKGALYRRLRMGIGAAAVILAAVGICVGGRWYRQMQESRIVTFDSQTLEMAVRDALEFDGEREITYADLKRIYELRVVGKVLLGAESKYYYQLGDNPDYSNDDKYQEKGDISDLSLLAQMPNLREVYLCNQNITDITPLQDLNLTVLALSENRIKDFSAISSMDSLRALYIGGNPIQDIAFLEGNRSLELLNLGNTTVRSLKPLESTEIAELWIMSCEASDGDYTVLAGMSELCRLYTYSFTEKQLASLNGCAKLQELILWGESGASDLSCLGGIDSLQVLILGNQFLSLDGIGNLKNLGRLILGAGVKDLTALADNSGLYELNILLCRLRVEDYALIAEHPGLQKVYCTPEQEEEILKYYPNLTTLKVLME